MTALAAVESPYVGLVRGVVDVLAAPDDARLHQKIAVSAAARLNDERLSNASGGGYSADPDRARLAALGEAVERYSATAYVPEEQFVLATAEEIGAAAVKPERFSLFAAEQHAQLGFAFARFTRNTRVRWILGRRIRDGAPAYLPAQLVYLPRARPEIGEAEIGYATSNGLACGAKREAALVAALLELLERDAFMITWSARLSLPRLAWWTSPTLRRFVRDHLEPTRLHFETVDLSCFHDVPTVLAVVHAEGRARGELGVGAAAAPTLEVAWRKAVAEAFAVRSAARSLLAEDDRVYASDFGDVETFEDHIRLYGRREQAVAAAFLDSSRAIRRPADVRPLAGTEPLGMLSELLDRLSARGLDAYEVDVTAPDVAEAGLVVMRVVVPELCPLDVRHDARFLGSKRLRDVPFELGLRSRPLQFDELNPDPHPFP